MTDYDINEIMELVIKLRSLDSEEHSTAILKIWRKLIKIQNNHLAEIEFEQFKKEE